MSSLYAGFDLARVGTMTCKLTTALVSDQLVTIPTDTYCHRDISSVMGAGEYTALAAALQTALFVVSPIEDFDIQFSTSTRLYTTANAGNRLQLDFTAASNGAAGPRLAAALGLTKSNSKATGAGTGGYDCVINAADGVITSDVLPYYLVPLARTNPMRYEPPYRPTGMVHLKRSVNGNGYAVKPLSFPTLIDLTLPLLPKENVFRDFVAAAQPWTIEDAIEHASAIEPLYFDFSLGNWVVRLSEDDGAFTKEMRENVFQRADFLDLWHVRFSAAQRLGTF